MGKDQQWPYYLKTLLTLRLVSLLLLNWIMWKYLSLLPEIKSENIAMLLCYESLLHRKVKYAVDKTCYWCYWYTREKQNEWSQYRNRILTLTNQERWLKYCHNIRNNGSWSEEGSQQVFSTCSLSNAQQGATPLILKQSLLTQKPMREKTCFSLKLWHQ